jgi:hypothetical protein
VSPPPRLVAHAEAWIAATGNPIPLPALLAAVRAWALGHGLIGLELDHQTQPLIGDPADHFYYETHTLLHQFGVTPDPAS